MITSLLLATATAAAFTLSEETLNQQLPEQLRTAVIKSVNSGKEIAFHPKYADEKLPPCSTFKIWNTALGSELGLIEKADEPFWKWDTVQRRFEAWNEDQTVRSAFQNSCVPAYQALARTIGKARMAEGLEKLGYPGRDISSGIDVFWLPETGRKTALITPREQVAMLEKLVRHQLGLSEKTEVLLKEIMETAKTERGAFYGKTGTGRLSGGEVLGWFVGYVESQGETYLFAATMKGKEVDGPTVRDTLRRFFEKVGLL